MATHAPDNVNAACWKRQSTHLKTPTHAPDEANAGA